MNLTELSDGDLLSHLQTLASQARVTLARLLATLAEVEERRLHLESACSSLFDFCIQRLGMSEGEAFRRITAARLARRFPAVLGCIERGELHLSSVVLLRDYLTVENHEHLLREASGKSKRGVQELIAAHFPRPDAPPRIRTLPPTEAAIEPLSVSRYKVQFTASAELRRKIDRATDLMRHRNPTGDLAVVMERALDLFLAQSDKERLGTRKQHPASREAARTTRPGYVTKAVRREVFERDGEQCAFVDTEGRRCSATTFLELDHVQPRALGGKGEKHNVRVLCRAHNRRMAERLFGRDHVEKQINLRQRKRAGAAPGIVGEPRDVTTAPVDLVLREGVAALIAKARATSFLADTTCQVHDHRRHDNGGNAVNELRLPTTASASG